MAPILPCPATTLSRSDRGPAGADDGWSGVTATVLELPASSGTAVSQAGQDAGVRRSQLLRIVPLGRVVTADVGDDEPGTALRGQLPQLRGVGRAGAVDHPVDQHAP